MRSNLEGLLVKKLWIGKRSKQTSSCRIPSVLYRKCCSWCLYEIQFFHDLHTELVKTIAYCNTLPHTATLSNTATHYNTLQRTAHTATRCKTLQHIATRCNTLQHAATHYNTLQHATTNCECMRFESQATNPTGSRALFPKGPTCIETSTFYNTREGIRGTGLFFWRDLSIEHAHKSDRACWRLALTLTHTYVIHARVCPLLVVLNLKCDIPHLYTHTPSLPISLSQPHLLKPLLFPSPPSSPLDTRMLVEKVVFLMGKVDCIRLQANSDCILKNTHNDEKCHVFN